jgi:hypothetical protein
MQALTDVIKEIVRHKEGIETALLGGSCKTFEEYKALVGELRGLSFTQQLLQDLVRIMENGDD